MRLSISVLDNTDYTIFVREALGAENTYKRLNFLVRKKRWSFRSQKFAIHTAESTLRLEREHPPPLLIAHKYNKVANLLSAQKCALKFHELPIKTNN